VTACVALPHLVKEYEEIIKEYGTENENKS
jgi:hypothetical protein